ncbi:DUF2029 domain-containing protein [bacterium]|nr:DUF2029 domain-containing protein [bacterium]
MYWPSMILATWLGLCLIYGWKSTQFMLELYDDAAKAMLDGTTVGTLPPAMAYPPPLVAFYIPISFLSEQLQRIAVLGVMAALLVFIFSTIQSMIVGKRSRKSTVLFWILIALVAGRFIVSPIENYSNDLLVAGFLVLGIRFWANSKENWGGVAMGVATACKATPLLFFPFLLLQRRWKAASFMLVVAAIVFVIPDVFFPRETGSWSGYWISLVTNSLHLSSGTNTVAHWSNWNQLNQSVAGTITRLFSYSKPSNIDGVNVCLVELGPTTIKSIILIARICIVGMLVVAIYKPSKAPIVIRRFSEGALIVCGMLLLSPMSSKAHFFILILPAAIMIQFYLWEKKDKWLAFLLIAIFVYGTLTSKGLIGKEAGRAVLATGSVTWCTFFAMLGTWRVMWLYSSSESSSSKKQ